MVANMGEHPTQVVAPMNSQHRHGDISQLWQCIGPAHMREPCVLNRRWVAHGIDRASVGALQELRHRKTSHVEHCGPVAALDVVQAIKKTCGELRVQGSSSAGKGRPPLLEELCALVEGPTPQGTDMQAWTLDPGPAKTSHDTLSCIRWPSWLVLECAA